MFVERARKIDFVSEEVLQTDNIDYYCHFINELKSKKKKNRWWYYFFIIRESFD